MPNPGIFAHYDSEGKLILDPQEDIRLTTAQVQAVQSALAGPQGRRAAPSSISLPGHITAAWWPLNDGAGTAPVDAVNGLVANVVGDTIQLWDAANYMTFGATTAVRIQNAAQVEKIFRLDNLTGSLIVGIEHAGGLPATSPQPWAWGYGDTGQATGGIGGVISNAQLGQFNYRAPSGSLTTASPGIMGNEKSMGRHIYHWVIHRNLLDSRLYVEGYIDGWQARGLRISALEGTESPAGDNSRGLRIGARPSGANGSANYIGDDGTLPQLRNFHAIRIDGDYRHRIPQWIDNICNTMPYGAIPEVLNHG